MALSRILVLMILIVDYGMGNLHSVKRKLDKLHVPCMISSDPKDLEKADKIILPGVGHFGKAMDNIQKMGWMGPLNKAVLVDKKPVLGICLGMQLMTKGSEEGSEKGNESRELRTESDLDHRKLINGLGWFDCITERLPITDTLRYKIPHTGWNTIEYDDPDPILKDVPSGSEVYFVHGFGVLAAPKDEVLTRTHYESPFISALRKGNIVGMQFHPEKSHETGMQLLKNFVSGNND